MNGLPLPISLLTLVLAQAACSTANNQASTERAIAPMATTRHGASHADAHYALGRYYQGQIRYDHAIQAYRQVLEAQPDHADAHNALGVIYALQGRQALAEQELRAALDVAPGAAHIHNNLGYALLLQGRAAEAVAAFEEALRLDPGHVRATDNLRLARAKLDVQAVAPSSPRGLAKDEESAAVLPSPSSFPGEGQAVARGVPVASNVYELQLPLPHRESSSLSVSPPASPVPRLEVANGNGVEGLARRTSLYLKEAGYPQARLTNQKPYEQALTEIQCRPGFEREAKQLQKFLAGKGWITEAHSLRQGIEVRVVLGRDLKSTAQMAAVGGEAFSIAALAHQSE